MRAALVALLIAAVAPLAGCGGAHAARDVAWPQRAERESDDKGGESLAPHQARAIAATGGAPAAPAAADDDDAKPAAAKPADDAKPAAPALGTPASTDDSLFGDDEITIEVTD